MSNFRKNLTKRIINRKAINSVQLTFNKVINGGCYQPIPEQAKCYWLFMCASLSQARSLNIITKIEENKAKKAINCYIYPNNTLYHFLKQNGHDDSFQARLDIYSDWKNRPKFRR